MRRSSWFTLSSGLKTIKLFLGGKFYIYRYMKFGRCVFAVGDNYWPRVPEGRKWRCAWAGKGKDLESVGGEEPCVRPG